MCVQGWEVGCPLADIFITWQNYIKCSITCSEYSKVQSDIYNLTFSGPCIVIYSYNKSQCNELFLNFILVKNSVCFGQTYCPSSRVLLLYSQQYVFVILVMRTVC
jgi:hypothetical protein